MWLTFGRSTAYRLSRQRRRKLQLAWRAMIPELMPGTCPSIRVHHGPLPDITSAFSMLKDERVKEDQARSIFAQDTTDRLG